MLPWGLWRTGCLTSGLIRSKAAVEVWKIPAHPMGSSQMAGAPPLSRWAVVWIPGSHTGLGGTGSALPLPCAYGEAGLRTGFAGAPGT